MTLKEAANNYVGHEPKIDESLPITCSRKAFIEGANWAIEKACKWLEKNAEKYILQEYHSSSDSDEAYLPSFFYDDFRKVMKE